MFTEENRPRCEKCGNKALSILNNIWLCGNCLTDYLNKLDEQKRKAILEE